MIAAVWAFLGKNPLASGLGILLLAAGLYIGWLTIENAGLERDVAKEKLALVDFKKKLAEKNLEVVQAAATKSDEQINKLVEEIRSVGLVASQAKTEIRYVKSSGGPCGSDPVWLTTVGSVQRVLDARGTGGDKGQAVGKPASIVRRPDAPGPNKAP